MRRKLAIAALAIPLVWLVAMAILGAAYGGRYGDGVASRIGESLGTTGTVGSADLALVRGRLELGSVAVDRDDEVGKLSLRVDSVRCELAPLGWALVDSTCDELDIRGVRLEASTGAVFHVAHPKRNPIHARRVVIDDAELAFAPSAFLPRLGRIAIAIEHAEAGDTVFRTPLSWLLSLEVLRARFDLPAGVTVRLMYENGVMSAEGSLFGSQPVRAPITLPVAAGLADAKDEMRALVEAGEDIAEKLVSKRASDWLRSKLR